MANPVCEKCKNEISPIDVVSCPNCDKKYHSSCWMSVPNCIGCGTFNKDYMKEKINKATVNINTNVKDRSASNEKVVAMDSGMFSNIGEKLKGWARAYFVISVVIAIIAVIATFIIDLFLFPTIVGVAIGIVLSAWIMSLILYAFGELVANSKESKIIQREILEELKKEK